MEGIKLDLVELRKLDLTFPYISKEDIQKFFWDKRYNLHQMEKTILK